LKSSETYYTKVIGSAHNNVGLLWANERDFRAASEQFRLAARGIRNWKALILTGASCYKAELFQRLFRPWKRACRIIQPITRLKQLLGLSYFMMDNYSQASIAVDRSRSEQAQRGSALLPACSLSDQSKEKQRKPTKSFNRC
jgi:hypothetical protein